ncbi:MAG: hypothetical protein ACI9WU_002811 [Myxococcota bacterium]|jgi:hypothetical protein
MSIGRLPDEPAGQCAGPIHGNHSPRRFFQPALNGDLELALGERAEVIDDQWGLHTVGDHPLRVIGPRGPQHRVAVDEALKGAPECIDRKRTIHSDGGRPDRRCLGPLLMGQPESTLRGCQARRLTNGLAATGLAFEKRRHRFKRSVLIERQRRGDHDRLAEELDNVQERQRIAPQREKIVGGFGLVAQSKHLHPRPGKLVLQPGDDGLRWRERETG